MNGHEKRKLKKMNEIKRTTFELCNHYGIQKVSVDEIAEQANVSKATIYKYFGSKEELIDDVVSDIYGRILNETKEMVGSDTDFLDKLGAIVRSKVQSFAIMQGDFLNEIFSYSNNPIAVKFHQDLKDLMYTFYDQGKEQGYIKKSIDNSVLYHYSELFNEGFQSLYASGRIDTSDREAIGQMIDLYFHGLIDKA